MKVALITPHYQQSTRGNAVTVRRLERHLSAAGCDVRVFSLEEYGTEELLLRVVRFAPDCIHAFHAFHGGKPACHLSRELGTPLVITMTGTDIYGAQDASARNELRSIISAASVLTVFHDSVRRRLLQQQPGITVPVEVIAQGVSVPEEMPAEPDTGRLNFFLPAGIRPVKNVIFPLEPLAVLYPLYPELRFELAGPVLDSRYGTEVMEVLERYPFAVWLGEIPHCSMAARYAAAAVVLNTSLSEGGMANSLLEAMASGRPVLVADIEGNRSLVTHGVTGLIYSDGAGFREMAAQLLGDKGLRRRLGVAGRRHVMENCSPVKEAERYLRLYAAMAGQSSFFAP